MMHTAMPREERVHEERDRSEHRGEHDHADGPHFGGAAVQDRLVGRSPAVDLAATILLRTTICILISSPPKPSTPSSAMKPNGCP